MGRFCCIMLLIGVIGILGLVSGCSEEQAPKPTKPKRVVFRIERPAAKKQEPVSKPTQPPQKEEPLQSKSKVEQKAQKSPSVGATKEANQQGVIQKGEAKTEDLDVEKRPQVVARKAKPGPKKEKIEEKQAPEQQAKEVPSPKGVYVVQEGESLFSISASQEVYSDPFKWPLLLWLNMAILEKVSKKGLVEHKELPTGTKLRFFTKEEIRDNLRNLGKKRWVVNMLSDKTTRGMSRLVVKLAKAGLPSYIVMSRIKGEVWFRLRAGFFGSSSEAKEIKKRIEEITGLKGLWLSKVSKQELEAYGGLIGQGSH